MAQVVPLNSVQFEWSPRSVLCCKCSKSLGGMVYTGCRESTVGMICHMAGGFVGSTWGKRWLKKKKHWITWLQGGLLFLKHEQCANLSADCTGPCSEELTCKCRPLLPSATAAAAAAAKLITKVASKCWRLTAQSPHDCCIWWLLVFLSHEEEVCDTAFVLSPPCCSRCSCVVDDYTFLAFFFLGVCVCGGGGKWTKNVCIFLTSVFLYNSQSLPRPFLR